MDNVGLGYLSLGRSAKTLSGGESQRIRLAAQLGSNLRGVLYVLDEPTIGLHPRDNLRLLETLTALRRKGNSLVIVEHDEETMRRADHIIDLGPGAGSTVAKSLSRDAARDRKAREFRDRPLPGAVVSPHAKGAGESLGEVEQWSRFAARVRTISKTSTRVSRSAGSRSSPASLAPANRP